MSKPASTSPHFPSPTFVVRIYRHTAGRPDTMAGVVEDVLAGSSRGFRNTRELLDLLTPQPRTAIRRPRDGEPATTCNT